MGETVSNGHAASAVWVRQTDRTWVSDFYLDTPNVGMWSPPIPQMLSRKQPRDDLGFSAGTRA